MDEGVLVKFSPLLVKETGTPFNNAVMVCPALDRVIVRFLSAGVEFVPTYML
jgi:hypothetical protein